MQKQINIVHYWAGCPTFMTSKWLSYQMLINKCTKHGWKNWLILSSKPSDPALIEPFLDLGCEIVYQPRSKGNFDFSSIYRNFKLLRKIKCDVFHCYNDHTSPLIAARFAKVPVRIWSKLSMSSYYETGISPKGIQKLMLSTWITCLFSSRVLAISNIAGKEICDQVGFKNKIITVYVPVSLERFMGVKGTKVRSEFNFNKSDIIVTSVGRSVPVKGWDIAIKAFVKVYKKIPNAKLLLVGAQTSVKYHQKLSNLIKYYGLDHCVVFSGSRIDIPEVLKASDVFLLPSRSEGTPAALVEAMSIGLPCIATATGGIPEVIENGENGLMFARENINELSEKLISILSDDELRIKLSAMGQKNLNKFAMEPYVDKVFSLYQELL